MEKARKFSSCTILIELNIMKKIYSDYPIIALICFIVFASL